MVKSSGEPATFIAGSAPANKTFASADIPGTPFKTRELDVQYGASPSSLEDLAALFSRQEQTAAS